MKSCGSAELQNWKVRVEASVEAADEAEGSNRVANPEMPALCKEALADLRAFRGLRDMIQDAVAGSATFGENQPVPDSPTMTLSRLFCSRCFCLKPMFFSYESL